MSIRARVCADAIEATGVDRVITLDLHAPQVQGFFKAPADDLYALPVLCDVIASKTLPNPVGVVPDAGFAKVDVKRLFMTDSVETQPVTLSSKVYIVSIAGWFGKAIRIANRECISVLFT